METDTKTQSVDLITVPFSGVTIEPATLTALWGNVLSVDSEISCIGEVTTHGSVIKVLPTQHVLEQTNTWTKTEIEADALAKLMTQYIRERRSPSLLRFWWHSHGPMQAYFSGTDEDTIAKLAKYCPDLFVAACFNNQGETYWRAVRNSFSVDWRFTIPRGLRPSAAEVKELKAKHKPLMKKEKGWRAWGSEWGFGPHSTPAATRNRDYSNDSLWSDRWTNSNRKVNGR